MFGTDDKGVHRFPVCRYLAISRFAAIPAQIGTRSPVTGIGSPAGNVVDTEPVPFLNYESNTMCFRSHQRSWSRVSVWLYVENSSRLGSFVIRSYGYLTFKWREKRHCIPRTEDFKYFHLFFFLLIYKWKRAALIAFILIFHAGKSNNILIVYPTASRTASLSRKKTFFYQNTKRKFAKMW